MLWVVLLIELESKLINAKSNDENQIEEHNCYKDNEKVMVLYTHAIINPIAMMVVSFNTFLADVAVS